VLVADNPMTANNVALQLKGVTKSFGGLRAVNALDLEIRPGEVRGLIGPNGAGKTTVINLISGIYKPTTGRIIFKGQDITGYTPHATSQMGIRRTFQQNAAFKDFTVLQNMIVAFHFNREVNLWTLWERSPIEAKSMKLLGFLGLEAMAYQAAKNLSHGHLRILGLAMALALDAEILLLDEPFSGMNKKEVEAMSNAILTIVRDSERLSVLLVEHNVGVIMDLCNVVTVLDFGHKIAEGPPEEITHDSAVIKAYLGGGEHAA
jgi:branched-chain amino acid transport system ATP-binding protein